MIGALAIWLHRAVLLTCTLSLCAGIWTLTQSPAAGWLVARSTEDYRQTVDRMLADALRNGGLEAALAEAQDDRAALRDLASLVERYDFDLSAEQRAQLDAASINAGLGDAALDCVRCMVDIDDCPQLSTLLSCNLPMELTPVGDVNALRRGAADWASGEPVDRLDVGLGLVGLGATAGVVVTGGTSATLKGGASLARVARRARLLQPALEGRLVASARALDPDWGRMGGVLSGRVALREAVDPDALRVLEQASGDLGAMRRNTSLGDAMALTRHAASPEDLTRLARISDRLGAETLRSVRVLGTARLARAMVRLSDLAIGMISLIAALGWLVLGRLLAPLNRLTRTLARRARARQSG